MQHLAAVGSRTSDNWRHHSQFRSRGNPWDIILINVFGDSWRSSIAPDPISRDSFVSKAFLEVGVKCPDDKLLMKPYKGTTPPAKKPRNKPPRVDLPPAVGPRPTVDLNGDSEIAIQWANGLAVCSNTSHREVVSGIQASCHAWWVNSVAAPLDIHSPWMAHVFREHNQEADYWAGRGAAGTSCGYAPKASRSSLVALRGFFDGSGGKIQEDGAFGQAGVGWVLYAWYQGATTWKQRAHACASIGKATSIQAELLAARQLVAAVDSILRHGEVLWTSPGWIECIEAPTSEFPKFVRRGAKRKWE